MPELDDAGSPTLFRSHFDRIRRRLEAEGKAARSFHHGLNRGLIREAFVREFLAENISGFWGVGTGEIFQVKLETRRPGIRSMSSYTIGGIRNSHCLRVLTFPYRNSFSYDRGQISFDED